MKKDCWMPWFWQATQHGSQNVSRFFCLQDPLFKISWLVMLVLTEAGPVSDMSVQKMSTSWALWASIATPLRHPNCLQGKKHHRFFDHEAVWNPVIRGSWLGQFSRKTMDFCMHHYETCKQAEMENHELRTRPGCFFLCMLGQFWLQPKVGDGLILCPSNPISTCIKEDDQVILRRLIKKSILKTMSSNGGFLKWWYPTTMGFPTKMISTWGGDWGYHHFRKRPNWSHHSSHHSRLAVVRDSISAKGQKGDPLQSLMSLGWDEVTPKVYIPEN